MTSPAGQQPPLPRPPSPGNLILSLTVVASLAGVAIVLVFHTTQPAILANRAEALRSAVFAVLPGASRVETWALSEDEGIQPASPGTEVMRRVHAGFDEAGTLKGLAIEAQGQGYQEVIKVLYGYRPGAESVVGLKILESKETPGLGDKIGKDPAFLASFEDLDARLEDDGKTLRQAIELVKPGQRAQRWQVDAITGATISSKAVVKLINKSLAARLPMLVKIMQTRGEAAR